MSLNDEIGEWYWRKGEEARLLVEALGVLNKLHDLTKDPRYLRTIKNLEIALESARYVGD